MSKDRGSSHSRADWIALAVTLLWSSSWVLIRWGLDDEAPEPITFAAMRYGIAAIALIAWAVARPVHRVGITLLDRSSIRRIVALGVVFYTLTQGAQFVAIDNQPAATTSLVLSLTPLLVAGFAARSLHEAPSSRQVAGAALVAIGAWVYFPGNLGATAVGLIAAMVALLANSAGTLLGRHVARPAHVSPLLVTAISMGVGAAILVVVGIVEEGWPHVSGRAWALIVWLAIVNTALAFTWWNLSLRNLSAIEASGINNTMLIQIAVLAWIFLDKSPGAPEVFGIILVSVGIFFTQAKRARRTSSSRV